MTNKIVYGLSGILLTLLILPVVAFVLRTVQIGLSTSFLDASILTALGLSLTTTAISMVGVVVLGTPLALLLARFTFPFKRIIAVFVDLPIVMPPVVAGLALLTAFGRRGLLGEPLGLSITFTPVAVIIAQMFVATPYYVRAVQFRLTSLPIELEEAARIDGASTWRLYRHILFPLSFPSMLSGLLLSWARAMGEFGATILFAGNLPGRTQTMPLLVYSALERDLAATFDAAFVLLVLALIVMGAVRWLTRLDEGETDELGRL